MSRAAWTSVDKGPRFERGQLLRHVDDDERWQVRVYLGRVGSRKQYAARVVYGTRNDAESVLADMLRDADSGALKHRKRMKLDAFLRDVYLPYKVDKITPETWYQYRQQLEANVIPRIGDSTLSAVTARRVSRMYRDVLKSGALGRPVTVSTVRQVHSILSDAFSYATGQGMMAFNPCREVDLPT